MEKTLFTSNNVYKWEKRRIKRELEEKLATLKTKSGKEKAKQKAEKKKSNFTTTKEKN